MEVLRTPRMMETPAETQISEAPVPALEAAAQPANTPLEPS
jgi:hypothetical protein